ncbi:MAG: hypothetical protein HY926_09285 [Elusimicrobia bacterium]|nr:hypothetical protein [Elusimicrobiota bacterium]
MRLLAAMGACILLIEGAARWAPALLPRPVRLRALEFLSRRGSALFVPDRELGVALPAPARLSMPLFPGSRIRHVLLPGESRIGFRGDFQDAARAGVDIVAIGDSHVYQVEVDEDETWISQLARVSGLRTANLGLPYQGTNQELRFYELYGARLRPKVVLLTVCPNDAWDNEAYTNWLVEMGGGEAQRPASSFIRYKTCLQLRLPSAACALATFLHRNSLLGFAATSNLWSSSYAAAIDRNLRKQEGLGTIGRDIQTMKSLVEGGGGRFGVILTDIWGFPSTHPQYLRMREILKARRIPFLDLVVAFNGSKDIRRRRREFLSVDNLHWNGQGSAFVAQEVYRFLRKRGFVRPPKERQSGAPKIFR